MENQKVNSCPEFPWFGATYPDAACINGYLWDLDSDDNGMLTRGGDDPCPFCNRDAYVQGMRDEEYTEEQITGHLEFIDKKYNS